MKDIAKLPVLLKDLRLGTVRHLWEDMATQARDKDWSHEKYLSTLCEHELSSRYQSRINRYRKEAKLVPGKSLATFDFKHASSINKAQIIAMAEQTKWVSNAENILIFGPSGVGKTHLAMAIGHSLIEQGIRVLFTQTSQLIQELQLAQKNLCLPQTLSKLDKFSVLILDDMGYAKKDERETNVLFELISERYESRSIIITCNQPFSEWDQIFMNGAMTVAAIDRVIHHATIIEINEASYRKKQAERRKTKHKSSN